MGRLIDADALIGDIQEQMKEVYANETPWVAQMTAFVADKMTNLVRRQPTAFDVEKVVYSVRADCYTMGFDESQTEILVDDVRRGGIDG